MLLLHKDNIHMCAWGREEREKSQENMREICIMEEPELILWWRGIAYLVSFRPSGVG